jgi:hypothetical protein
VFEYNINKFMRSRPKNSLEDAIRNVQAQYKNRPSPLQLMNENIGFAPSQISQELKVPKDIRSNLLGNFIPSKDTFR